MVNLIFEVKRRRKTETGDKTDYEVLLISTDGAARMTIRSSEPSLFQLFIKGDVVPCAMGPAPQKQLAEYLAGQATDDKPPGA